MVNHKGGEMTSQQERVELHNRLDEVLGQDPATTLWSMLSVRDDLATKGDLATLRDELKGDIAELRSDMGELKTEMRLMRQEMELKYATKDDLLGAVSGFNETMAGHVRTFIVVQAATVVGMSGILYGLLRLT